jgi:tetratricopeptide (TPR) repeat protein
MAESRSAAGGRWRRVAGVSLALMAGLAGCTGRGSEGQGDIAKGPVLSCPEEQTTQERIACYEAALRKDPGDPRILAQLAAAFVEAGDLTAAVDRLTQAIRLDPDDPALFHQLGAAFEDLGDRERAIENYKKVLDLVASPEVHVMLGMLLSEQGKHEEAVTNYEEALVLEPDDADAHYNLGVELAKEGRYQEAAEHYRNVLRIDDGHAEAANNLGAALFSLGRVADAVEYFERSVRLDPADVQARGNWAMALRAQGRVGESIKALEEGLARSPGAAALANQLAWVRATTAEAEWRDGKEAVRLAEMACELTGRADGNYLDTLAAAYAEDGRFEDAVRTVNRAIELEEANSELANEFRRRLSIYEDGKPYREPK